MADIIFKEREDSWSAPEWAKEATLKDIKNSSENMAKLLEIISSAAVKDKETAKQLMKEYKKTNELLSDSIDTSDDVLDQLKTNDKNDRGRGKKTDKHHYEMQRSSERLAHTMDGYSRSIGSHIRTMSSVIDDNFENMGRRVGDIAGSVTGSIAGFLGGKILGPALSTAVAGVVGGAIGVISGIIQSYADSLVNLSDSGAAFGIQLDELRNQASRAGMNLESFSALISSNTTVLRGLSGAATSSMNQYSMISANFLDGAERASYFGMRISDLNEVLMQEIELRRRSGHLAYTSTSQMANSMNELLYQTTAMASITGQNRRDLLRNRQEMLSDSSIAAYASTLGEYQKEAFMSLSVFSDLFGENITSGIQSGIVSGFGVEKFVAPQLAFLQNIVGNDFSKLLQDYQEGIKNAGSSQDVLELLQQMLARIGGMNIDEKGLTKIIQIAESNTENSQAAKDALQVIANSRGLNYSLAEIQKMTIEELKNIMSQGVAAIPAQSEIMAKAIRASLMETVDGILKVDELGGSIGSAMSSMTDYFKEGDSAVPFEQALEAIGTDVFNALSQLDMLEVLKDIRDFLGPTGSSIVAIIAALSAINVTLGGISLLKNITKLTALTATAASGTVGALAGSLVLASSTPVGKGSSLTEIAEDRMREQGHTPDTMSAEDFYLLREKEISKLYVENTPMSYESYDQKRRLHGSFTGDPVLSGNLSEITNDAIPVDQQLVNRNISNMANAIFTQLERVEVEKEESLKTLIERGLTIPDSIIERISDKTSLRRIESYNELISELRALREDLNQGNRKAVSAFQEGPQ